MKQVILLLAFLMIGLMVANSCWTVYKSFVMSSAVEESVFETKKTSRHKLLIAQYTAGPSSQYSQLLNLTSFVNKAYAARWGYNYYIRHGFPFGIDEYIQRTNVSVSESVATYNKVQILLNTIDANEYDMLLLLDADAMMYDFDFDIANLLPPEKVMAAHKVDKNDTIGTWNVNIGVTLWNLKNPSTKLLASQWKEKCMDRIKSGRRDSDQMPFHKALKNMTEEERTHVIVPLEHEFRYREGTVVKHFIRVDNGKWKDEGGMEQRVAHVQDCVHQVCARYYLNCSSP